MPPKDENQAAVDKLLDKEGLKTAKLQGTDKKVVLPKNVRTEPEKFKKKYDEIRASMALAGTELTASEFVNLFNYYVKNVLEAKVSERIDRYNHMDFIIENDGSISLAKKVLRDEIMQADVFEQPVTVTARNVKFKKAIIKLFNDLGIKNLITETGENLIKYGDAFWVMDIDKKNGVQKVIPTDPRDVKHRFEFSIAELKQKKMQLKKQFDGLQTIIDLGSKVNTNASQFNRVLLGFQILDTIFPFWQVLHFRQFTTKKNIFPFGKPTFYESQSEARMYLNSKVVVSMIRSSAFIREYVQVKTAEDMDPSEQWEMVQQVKQMMELFIDKTGKTNKDVPSFGQRYYYPEALLTIEQREAGVNFRDRYEDLQLMREDVFTSTGMPKGYFVGEGGQYVPIKALMQQDKKTARMVYDLQNITISQLIKLVETHFTFTGEFNPYEEEYAIALPYPIPDIDDTMIGVSQAKMQYATSTIDGLKSTLNITKLPERVVKTILLKYFPLNDDEVLAILQQMKKDTAVEEVRGIDPYGKQYGDPFMMSQDQKQQMQMQTDQMQQQAETPPEGEVPPEGKAPAADQAMVNTPKGQIPLEQAMQMSDEELTKLGLTPEEIDKIRQQQQAFAAEYNKKNGQLYEQKFMEAVKKKDLKEAIHEVRDNIILNRDSSDFSFMNNHYVTNKYVSQDRNNKGVVRFEEPDAKKMLMEARAKHENENKLRGITELHDTIIDQRYLSKEEKEKELKNKENIEVL